MLTLGGRDPSYGAELNRGVLGTLVNIIICGSFGADRSWGLRGGGGSISACFCPTANEVIKCVL